MTYVKICGLTCPEDAVIISGAGANYAGFVFYENSTRNLTKYMAAEIIQHLSPQIAKIAVLVSPGKREINMAEDMGFDCLQIHGELKKEALEAAHIPIWRAYNISGEMPEIEDDEKIKAYVIDGGSYGSGEAFDWEKYKDIREKLFGKYFSEFVMY